MAFDGSGKGVYFACLRFNRETSKNDIVVARSTNKGKKFKKPTIVVEGTGSEDFNDKEYIAADTTGGPCQDTVYVSWTHFTATQARIRFSRSTDKGRSFSAPMTISDTQQNQGSVPAVGPSGEVYVVWQDFISPRMMIDKSSDCGRTFGTDRVVATITPIPTPLPGFGWNFRTNGFPTLGLDTSRGSFRGNVYVAWADFRNGDADILFSRSTDGGQTWSDPIRINGDVAGNGRHQFFPWMSVDPNGTIHIVFYDNRRGDGSLLNLFYAQSTDGGTSFGANEQVTDRSFDPNIQFKGGFIGDYNGVTATEDTVHPLWTDTRDGNQDVFTDTR